MNAVVLFRYGRGRPVAVLCSPESDPPGQRYFTVVADDSPGPESEPKVETYHCGDCLLDVIDTELARGLDVAFAHRGARRDGDGWVPAPELWDA